MSRANTNEPGRWMTREELPPDALVRLEHAGEWVAWDSEMQTAIATGPDHATVRAAAIAAGAVRPVCEWVPPVEIRPMDYIG